MNYYINIPCGEVVLYVWKCLHKIFGSVSQNPGIMESWLIIAHYDWWTEVGSINYNWSTLTLRLGERLQCQQIV